MNRNVEPDADDLDDEEFDEEPIRRASGGTATATHRRSTSERQRAPHRTTITEFFRQVRDEMRQVAWPTRKELINYTGITLTVLVIMTTYIYFLNLAFAHWVIWLFTK